MYQTPPRGFSLIEVLVAIAIVGVVMAVAVPSSVQLYEGMQRREAVRTTMEFLNSARERALATGTYQDVMVKPASNQIWNFRKRTTLSDAVRLQVHGAAELNFDQTGVIRFYPDGSSSGGGVDLARADGSGTRVTVDWLIGRVEQTSL
ncbi:MAG: GspH/FimT family pseudopilin [Pseudomonadota bacterium]